MVIIVAGIFTFLYVNDDKSDEKLTKIRVNEVTRSVFYAPQYVAISQGFFQKQNIEIELSQLKTVVESMEENVLLEIEFEKGKGGLDNAGIRSCEY